MLLFVAAADGQLLDRVSVVPQQIAAGSHDFKIKIVGDSFKSTMQVQWNGMPRATQFVNEFLLKATITRADLAMPGLAQLSVVDTSSGQTVSDTIPMLVYLPIANNDFVYDSARDKIYVSVSKQDANGPALAIVDPELGVIERYLPLPSEPGPLALSADSNTLYVGMSDRIRRIDLTGTTNEVDVPASAFFSGETVTFSLQPLSLLPFPGQPTSFVVTLGFLGPSTTFVVDGTTARANPSHLTGTCLIAIPDGVTLYSGPGLREAKLSDTGFPSALFFENDALVGGSTCPAYANGLIYGSDGDVVDAVSNSRVRWLSASGNVDVVPENNEVHFLDTGGSNPGNGVVLKAFDSQSGALLKSVPLGVQVTAFNGGPSYGNFIHWGSNGIAFGDYSTPNSSVAKWLYLIRVP